MIFSEDDIDFNSLSSVKFEELCYDLLSQEGFQNLVWRQGGADDGRDIEAELTLENNLIGNHKQRWFFECKRYSSGVPVDEISSKFDWASAEKVDYLVIITSSYLTTSSHNYIEKKLKSCDFRFFEIDGKKLKKILLRKNNFNLLDQYFIDQPLRILRGEFEKWRLFEATPDTQTFEYVISAINFDRLKDDEIAFLWIVYLEKVKSRWEERSIDTLFQNKIINQSIKKFRNPSLKKTQLDCSEWNLSGWGKCEAPNNDLQMVLTTISMELHDNGGAKYLYRCDCLKDDLLIEIFLPKSADFTAKVSILNLEKIENISVILLDLIQKNQVLNPISL